MPPDALLIARVGLDASSLTFKVGAWIYGCDATAGPKELPGPWCGGAVGRADLPIFDPRLDILCRNAKRRALGLAWIEPLAGARYVVVRERGYAEVYEVAAGLPVRIATRNVDVASSSATFRVEQYGASGRRLTRRTFHAHVAG